MYRLSFSRIGHIFNSTSGILYRFFSILAAQPPPSRSFAVDPGTSSSSFFWLGPGNKRRFWFVGALRSRSLIVVAFIEFSDWRKQKYEIMLEFKTWLCSVFTVSKLYEQLAPPSIYWILWPSAGKHDANRCLRRLKGWTQEAYSVPPAVENILNSFTLNISKNRQLQAVRVTLIKLDVFVRVVDLFYPLDKFLSSE